jgi:hypothetical protein
MTPKGRGKGRRAWVKLMRNRAKSWSTQFNPEDGGRMFLRNVGISLQDYTLSQARIGTITTVETWKHICSVYRRGFRSLQGKKLVYYVQNIFEHASLSDTDVPLCVVIRKLQYCRAYIGNYIRRVLVWQLHFTTTLAESYHCVCSSSSSSLLLAFASMVILGVEPHRDPWPYFCSHI